jgi:methionyl-tRNA formyltransferase
MTPLRRIIFMGTPDFAVPSLNALHRSGYTIPLVVTQPDRPAGRGRRLVAPPVKIAAETLGLNLFQPQRIASPAAMNRIAEAAPDGLVVVAFGQLLPQALIELAPLGAINLHASLLPSYRGPAPIQWAIINGDQQTGITTMLLDTGVDTGDMLLRKPTPISKDDTAATLHDRLALMGSALLTETLREWAANRIEPMPQPHDQASYAPLLKKDDGRIDWHKTATTLDRFIRGVSPWPGAFTFCNDRRLKIFRAHPVPYDTVCSPGTIVESQMGRLIVATGKDALSILELQGESGKRLNITDFLCGTNLCPGMVLG